MERDKRENFVCDNEPDQNLMTSHTAPIYRTTAQQHIVAKAASCTHIQYFISHPRRNVYVQSACEREKSRKSACTKMDKSSEPRSSQGLEIPSSWRPKYYDRKKDIKKSKRHYLSYLYNINRHSYLLCTTFSSSSLCTM